MTGIVIFVYSNATKDIKPYKINHFSHKDYISMNILLYQIYFNLIIISTDL